MSPERRVVLATVGSLALAVALAVVLFLLLRWLLAP